MKTSQEIIALSRQFSTGTALFFEDGFDFLWLPGSDLPVVERIGREVFERWNRLNDGRQKVIAALRHHAADKSRILTFQPWGVVHAEQGGSQFDFSVARDLTRALEKFSGEQALIEFTRELWDLKIDGEDTARELLARGSAEPNPAQAMPGVENPLGAALTMLFASTPSSLLDDPDADLEDGLRITAERLESDNAALIDELRKRLPPDALSTDLEKPGKLQLDFPDGEDSLAIVPYSRRTRRLLERQGVVGLADRILARHRQLGQQRQEALAALDHLMARVGLTWDSFYHGRGRAYGRVHREITFDSTRALTLSLTKRSAEDALRRWWAVHESSGALPALDNDDWSQALTRPHLKPERRMLFSKPPSAGRGLPALDPAAVQRADKRAAELIREFRHLVESGDTRLLDWWQQPSCYHRGHDTWVDESWWLGVAREHWQQSQNHDAAAILLAHGDDTPREAILEEFIRVGGYWDEYCNPWLVWQLWDELPWEVPDELRPAFPFTLGTPPPEHAWRLAQITRSGLLTHLAGRSDDPEVYIDQLPRNEAIEWLSADEIQAVHDCYHLLAASTEPSLMLDEHRLHTAQNMGWSHLADVLSENPLTLASMEEWDFPAEGLRGLWAARISAVCPTEFTARLSLSLLEISPDEIERKVTQSTRQFHDHCLKTARDFGAPNDSNIERMHVFYQRDWLEALFMAAIAWQRWSKTRTADQSDFTHTISP